MKRRDLERHLREHGCVLDHRGNEHDIWINTTTVGVGAVPRHREIKTGTARGICRSLRIPEPPFR